MADSNTTATTSPPPTSVGPGATASSQTVSATPEQAAPAAAAGVEEFRYKAGPGVPEWLVGKNATEAAALTQQLYQQLVSSSPAPAGSVPYTAANFGAPPAQPHATGGVPDADEFIHDPAGATQRLLDRVRRNEVMPEFQARDNVIGQQARALAELQFKDEFRRWGPEIDMMLNQIPGSQRTPQAVGLVVDVVRSRHMDEMVAEKTEAKIRSLVEGGTLRPQSADGATGAGTYNRVDFDKLPPNYRSYLNRLGVTQDTVDEVLRKAYPNLPLNKAREKWAKSAERGDVITDMVNHVESETPVGGSDNG